MLSLFCIAAYAESTDHIGPDPIKSENCLTITPGHSVVCSGRQFESESNFRPTVTFNCGPGIFILLTHEPISYHSSLRDVTLLSDDGNFTEQWLAVSATQSAMLVFYSGADSSDYYWILRLMGRLQTPGASLFGYSIENKVTRGIFELDYSDVKLIEQITPNCG